MRLHLAVVCFAVGLVPLIATAAPWANESADSIRPSVEVREDEVITETISCEGIQVEKVIGPDGVLVDEARERSWMTTSIREVWREGDVVFAFARTQSGDAGGWKEEIHSFVRSDRQVIGGTIAIDRVETRTFRRRLNLREGGGPGMVVEDSTVLNTYLLGPQHEVLVRRVRDEQEISVPQYELSVSPFQGGRTEVRRLKAPYWDIRRPHDLMPAPMILDTLYVEVLKDDSSCTFTVVR